jgi:hypothetical protein
MGKRKRGNVFGKNRIMIRPKDDGAYMIELRTAAREALAISSDGETIRSRVASTGTN